MQITGEGAATTSEGVQGDNPGPVSIEVRSEPSASHHNDDADTESDVDEEELQRLRALHEKRQKKAEIIALRARIAGKEPGESTIQAEAPIPKRPISNDYSPESNKHLRPAAPETYSGREGIKGLHSFLTVLELYFDAVSFAPEAQELRVRHAAAYLRGEAAKAYLREKQRITTWEEFTTFLKGTIKDPASRLAAATSRLHGMRQRGDQTARQLLHEIESVEQDIPLEMTLEARQAWHFLNSLNLSLRNAVMTDIKEVVSRDQILAAAQRQEDLRHDRQEARERAQNAPNKRIGGDTHARPAHKDQTKRFVSKETKEKTTYTKDRDIVHKERQATGACFTCGSLEHQSGWHKRHPGSGEAQTFNKGSAKPAKN